MEGDRYYSRRITDKLRANQSPLARAYHRITDFFEDIYWGLFMTEYKDNRAKTGKLEENSSKKH